MERRRDAWSGRSRSGRRGWPGQALLALAIACGAGSAACAQVYEVDAQGGLIALGQDHAPSPGRRDPANASGEPDIPQDFRPSVSRAAARYGISPWLIDAVARTESDYRADAMSSAGAIGVMQLMPDTARELGVDPHQPDQNIQGGAAYLRKMLDRFDGRIDLALAAYNAGSAAVLRHGGIPPFAQTREYVATNLARLAAQRPAQANPFAFNPSPLSGEPQ